MDIFPYFWGCRPGYCEGAIRAISDPCPYPFNRDAMLQKASYQFGLIGLGVMGRNFMLNVAEQGFRALGYDLDKAQVQELREAGGDPDRLQATPDLQAFVRGLEAPRKIMLLVPAGKAVDAVIENLLPHLEAGDLIIDGGNSHFEDTDRREAYLRPKRIHFLGTGVSGGADGARRGPSIMPGGDREAYRLVQPIFEAVAARYRGAPCVAYLGPKSAGNYVKMVHNGIEYGLMQLISEVYDMLKQAGGLSNKQLAAAFGRWNQGRLQSFLVEISALIFGQKDPLGTGELIDAILDQAQQKGTGKWTSQNAMDLGIPVPTLDISVSMRALSALKESRVAAQGRYTRPAATEPYPGLASDCETALYFSFLLTYAQGFHQLSEASRTYGYGLDLATVARIWRAGCIIRSAALEPIAEAFERQPGLNNLVLADAFREPLQEASPAVRRIAAHAVSTGVPMPALCSTLSYFDAFTSGRLPMNLVQAQRDYFGSHTYQRLDREGVFHTDWPGTAP